MVRNLIAWSVLACTGTLLAWSPYAAQPKPAAVSAADETDMESFLPASAVAACVFDGFAAHQPALSDTAAWKALDESGFRARVLDLVEAAIAAVGPGEAREARQMVEHVMQQGLAASASVSRDAGSVAPWAVIVLRNAAKFQPFVERVLTSAFGNRLEIERSVVRGHEVGSITLGNSPIRLSWFSHSDHLVATIGAETVEEVLAIAESDGDDITSNPHYARLRKSDKFTVDSLGWLDLAVLIDQFGEIVLPDPSAAQPMTIRGLLDILGLSNLKGLSMQTGYSGKECWSFTSLDVDGEMTGLLSLLKQREMTLDDLPAMPPDTAGFFAATFDVGQGYESVLSVVRRIASMAGPRALDDMAEYDEAVSALFGGDPAVNGLDALGDVWCIYSDPAGMPIPIGFAPVVCFSVRDRDKLLNTVERLTPMLEQELGDSRLNIRRSWKEGNLYVSFNVPGMPIVPTIVVMEDWAVMSLVPGSAQSFVLRQQGELPSWEPNEEVQAALAELPSNFTSITVSDPAPGYTQLLNFAPMAMNLFDTQVVPNLPEGANVRIPFGVEDLPVVERVVGPMFPNVAVGTVTENGAVSWSRHSVPSNPIGTVGVSATTPVLIALLLPAVQQAREAARRTQSRNNLKQLALAAHNYHDTYRSFPRGTVENEDLEPDERLSWAYSLLPFIEQAPLYNRIDKSSGWQADANQQFRDMPIEVFLNPSQSRRSDQPAALDYIGIAGVGPDAAMLPTAHPKAGIFGYNRATRIRDIVDGTSNTLMFGDASEPAVSWLAGGRETIRGFSQSPYLNGPDGIGSPHTGVVQFAFADGSVRVISVEIDESVLEKLATKAGGEVVDPF